MLCPYFFSNSGRNGYANGRIFRLLDTGESEDPENPRLLEECYGNFRKEYKKYNAVICYNTQATVYLCARAKEEGIRVPEDLYVIGQGYLALAELVHPSITTVSLNEIEVGQQIVKLFRYLCSNPYIKNVTVLVNSIITPRKSTENFTLPSKEENVPDDSFLKDNHFSSPAYIELDRLEAMLSSCTDMDLRILEGVRRGIPRETLAE